MDMEPRFGVVEGETLVTTVTDEDVLLIHFPSAVIGRVAGNLDATILIGEASDADACEGAAIRFAGTIIDTFEAMPAQWIVSADFGLDGHRIVAVLNAEPTLEELAAFRERFFGEVGYQGVEVVAAHELARTLA